MNRWEWFELEFETIERYIERMIVLKEKEKKAMEGK